MGRIAAPKGQRLTPDLYTPHQWACIREAAEASYYFFVCLMFRAVWGRRWLDLPFQRVICKTMENVYYGRHTQIIVNAPPRYGKTFLFVIMWVAWCLAKAPTARFLHTSYSDELALSNSSSTKYIMLNPIYQMLWPRRMRADTDAKKSWTLEGTGGGLNAAPTGGQLTGFGAGVTGYGPEEFGGAVLIDDPLKPRDALSDTVREGGNDWYGNTIESRRETPYTPVVIGAQRLHEHDMPGFMLTDGAHGRWDHLNIPALIEPEETYPEEWAYGDLIDHGLPPGPINPAKHDRFSLAQMAQNPVTRHVYWTQYMQRPTVRGGGMIEQSWLNYWDEYDPLASTIDGVEIISKRIYADTALKAKERNDFSALGCFALGSDGRVYLLDLAHGRWEAPELLVKFSAFVGMHAFRVGSVHCGLSRVAVEDKASGTGLIQTVNLDSAQLAEWGVHAVDGIQRNTDKVSRMAGVSTWIEAGRLVLPRGAPWLAAYTRELTAFNRELSHAHDDCVDITMDAVQDMLIDNRNVGVDYVAAMR